MYTLCLFNFVFFLCSITVVWFRLGTAITNIKSVYEEGWGVGIQWSI